MDFIIKHDIKNRMRVHLCQNKMTYRQADLVEYYLLKFDNIKEVKIYEKTCNVAITYKGNKNQVIDILNKFSYKTINEKNNIILISNRELNANYREKLIKKVAFKAVKVFSIPKPVKTFIVVARAVPYFLKAMKSLINRKLEVTLLDAIAIGVSIGQNNFNTASSVMFLLGIGEILEEWSHKKSVNDLARNMSLNVSKIWLIKDNNEILVNYLDIKKGDVVVIRMGNVIPFDGVVVKGESLVNQASLTGEPLPIRKTVDGYVFAGSVVEEGEIQILVKECNGTTKIEKITKTIEESEKLKSLVEGKALKLADKLVPITILGTGLTYLLTKNITKALAVLMVDFSCALKLAMPITMLSGIREAYSKNITVKGGKFLEAIAEADTIVFDKTGTLTVSKPSVAKIVTLSDKDENECLRISACLEEHFPHSVAKAVVDEAKKRNLLHEEMHSKVDYVVAHGISSTINGEKVVIGSNHFVFDDEKCSVSYDMKDKFCSIEDTYSKLYLAIKGIVIAVICIEDPLREEAKEVIEKLKIVGFKNIVMMTGDSKNTARSIAEKVGITDFFAEVLPNEKKDFIEQQKLEGHKVVMVGDGVNDAPALSASDAGIAISNGAELAREVADIIIEADELHKLVELKLLSVALMKRINKNYNYIVSINALLILLGVLGYMKPTTSALLHNTSTLSISLLSMKNLLD